ncbi:hypothetical protein EII29_08170 [Leptotrichia sp. OH3620_COT-345]|uniref:hypothetical protein n=1 Tax=Leptotrichia sp. OH3620_COT-345 TaxID=2491048 RepID=UPI000F651640|nr:hypothetical protein [Leptotrichia sp. OH3620_COT-345]RRD39208.1 hypothetical protein EII29_08170 [Leptotrichia sp. OH3620_COT-345]
MMTLCQNITLPLLYTKYKNRQLFNDYFSKVKTDIKFKNTNSTVFAKYNDSEKPKFFEISLRRTYKNLGKTVF